MSIPQWIHRTLGSLLAATLLLSPAYAAEPLMRIVSSGGSVTEVLFALGQGDWVVATDSTSQYPPAAAQITKLGYFRQLGTEGVLAQRPTHLIGAQATGPQSMLEQIAAAGVTVTLVGEERSLHGLYSMIDALGVQLNVSQRAEVLKAKIHSGVQLQQQLAQANGVGGLKALYVVAHNDRGLTVAGNHTVPQALFDTLGLDNVAASIDSYKLFDKEALILANPQLILLAGHSADNPDAVKQLCQHPAVRTSFAGQHCLVATLDSSIGLGLSPRFPQALEQINQLARQAAALAQRTSVASTGVH